MQRIGGRYQLLDLIGRGGMAQVYRAHDDVLDRLVAVKVFQAAQAGIPEGSDRVRRHAEVRALAALNHPNLTTLYDASLDSDPPFLVLELIDGPSLERQLAGGPLPAPSVAGIGMQVADALGYVHARNMVHRDVKPANILLGPDAASPESPWRVRLSDFGIVRLMGTQRLTLTNFTMGSASYLAPEQARGADVGPPADIYSLGLVLIEALTGRRCFEGSTPDALAVRLTQPPAVPLDAPAPWPDLLTAMTALDPAARPSATDVAAILRRGSIAGTPVDAFAATTQLAAVAPVAAAGAAVEVDAPEPRRHPGRLIAALLAVIVVGIIAIMHSSLPGLGGQSPAPADKGATQSTQDAQPGAGATAHSPTASVVRNSIAPRHRSGTTPTTTARRPATPPATSRVVVPPATSTPAPSTAPSTAPTTAPTTPTPSPTQTTAPPATTTPSAAPDLRRT